MNNKSHLLLHIPDPFDASARARLRNMGVTDDTGTVDAAVMQVFAHIFTALFLDDICDFYDDAKDLRSVCNLFAELYRKEAYHHMYLFLSVQYDYVRKSLPDPVWWLAGDAAAIKAFMEHFMAGLKAFMSQKGFFDAGCGEVPQ